VNKKAFTIVELMVAMAIVVVLSSILMPAFAAAKERAKQTVCESNLHQLHIAMRLYSDDFDGLAPCYTNSERYLSLNATPPSVSNQPEELVKCLGEYVKSTNVWFCPSDRFARRSVYYLDVRHLFSSYEVITWDPGEKSGSSSVPRLNLDNAPQGKFFIGDAVASRRFSEAELKGVPPFPAVSNHGQTVSQYVDVSGTLHRVAPRFLIGGPNG
jgi:prepilin-type N-terminal cleavage/methylation domain-containing protein